MSLAGIVIIAAFMIVSAVTTHDSGEPAPLPSVDDRVGICTTTEGATAACGSETAVFKIVSTANGASDCGNGAFFTYPDKKSYCAEKIG